MVGRGWIKDWNLNGRAFFFFSQSVYLHIQHSVGEARTRNMSAELITLPNASQQSVE